VYLDVEDNPNCAGRDPMRYRELGPVYPLAKVRIFDRRDEGEWCRVTAVGPGRESWRPAGVRRVEDSGVGTAYLVFGGEWGIRLCPIESQGPWNLEDRTQWGEPYLLLTDPHDLVIDGPEGP
jgi:hypothetical protein